MSQTNKLLPCWLLVVFPFNKNLQCLPALRHFLYFMVHNLLDFIESFLVWIFFFTPVLFLIYYFFDLSFAFRYLIITLIYFLYVSGLSFFLSKINFILIKSVFIINFLFFLGRLKLRYINYLILFSFHAFGFKNSIIFFESILVIGE